MTEERMPFQAEVARLLEIVTHALYSDKDVFLRELISNASDACDRLRYEALTQPELTGEDSTFTIRVTTDPKARTLVVSDNGLGMTRDELIENLGTIARSGTAAFLERLKESPTASLTQIGQFGVGFYAAFMVAQMVEVRSRKAGSDESWCWRSDGRGAFAVEEDSKPHRGTEVTLYLKQGLDEFLEDDRLRSIITRYSDHIALPILLNGEETPANRAAALWLRPKADITPEQYTEFYHHVAHAFDDPALTVHWRAEGKLEYAGLLFVPGTKPFDLFDPKRQHGVKLYVKRVFITDHAEGLVPAWLRFVRGVVDSEDLPLNVSREMLQNNPVVNRLRQGLTRRVLDELASFAEKNPAAYAPIWDNFGAVLKEGLYEDAPFRESLLKVARFRTTHDDRLVSLAEVAARKLEGQEAIYYINGDDPAMLSRSPHLEGFRAQGVEVLLLTDAVDDFWPGAVETYEGLPLRSVTRAEKDLGPLGDKGATTSDSAKGKDSKKDSADSQTSTPDEPPVTPEVAALLAFMRGTLKEAIHDVRVSTQLTESPVCLKAAHEGLDIHLERFLKKHHQNLAVPSPRLLEINPNNTLIQALAAEAAKAATAKPETEAACPPALVDSVWLLLEQARILEGEVVPDPFALSARLNAVLARGLK